MTTARKTALGQVRNRGVVPKLIATQSKSDLAKDVVTYPAALGVTLPAMELVLCGARIRVTAASRPVANRGA